MNTAKIAKLSESAKHKWKGTIQIPCSNCGRLLWITKYYLKKKEYKNYFCDKKCEGVFRSYGNNESLYCNLRKRKENSYIYCKYNGKRYLQHRAEMEKYLKRTLMPEEIVHHINGRKDDNRIENLVIVSKNNHEANTLYKLAQKRIRELENNYGISTKVALQ